MQVPKDRRIEVMTLRRVNQLDRMHTKLEVQRSDVVRGYLCGMYTGGWEWDACGFRSKYWGRGGG